MRGKGYCTVHTGGSGKSCDHYGRSWSSDVICLQSELITATICLNKRYQSLSIWGQQEVGSLLNTVACENYSP